VLAKTIERGEQPFAPLPTKPLPAVNAPDKQVGAASFHKQQRGHQDGRQNAAADDSDAKPEIIRHNEGCVTG
jgi:hypothetical protein